MAPNPNRHELNSALLAPSLGAAFVKRPLTDVTSKTSLPETEVSVTPVEIDAYWNWPADTPSTTTQPSIFSAAHIEANLVAAAKELREEESEAAVASTAEADAYWTWSATESRRVAHDTRLGRYADADAYWSWTPTSTKAESDAYWTW